MKVFGRCCYLEIVAFRSLCVNAQLYNLKTCAVFYFHQSLNVGNKKMRGYFICIFAEDQNTTFRIKNTQEITLKMLDIFV